MGIIARQIANAHTCFNVAMTLIWLPLVPVMVKLVTLALPERPRRPRNPIMGADQERRGTLTA